MCIRQYSRHYKEGEMPMKQRGLTEEAWVGKACVVWSSYTQSTLYAGMQRTLHSPCATK